MKVGDIYEASSGMSFTISNVTAKVITVNVERKVRRGRASVVETRSREVPAQRFEQFARPYKKKTKR